MISINYLFSLKIIIEFVLKLSKLKPIFSYSSLINYQY
ncbi:hypothetical protein BGAPBR_E0027 (plasmid) [Borreliella garinii PBr]|uniref:Uncharacterized protein n=1 Tax=Borreliella garinii PBr TaxID=498743 RepID=B8F0K7_BORGR|nr:hypothetical protein BGAPBR_E0027 [Borreliella garinii PBr]